MGGKGPSTPVRVSLATVAANGAAHQTQLTAVSRAAAAIFASRARAVKNGVGGRLAPTRTAFMASTCTPGVSRAVKEGGALTGRLDAAAASGNGARARRLGQSGLATVGRVFAANTPDGGAKGAARLCSGSGARGLATLGFFAFLAISSLAVTRGEGEVKRGRVAAAAQRGAGPEGVRAAVGSQSRTKASVGKGRGAKGGAEPSRRTGGPRRPKGDAATSTHLCRSLTPTRPVTLAFRGRPVLGGRMGVALKAAAFGTSNFCSSATVFAHAAASTAPSKAGRRGTIGGGPVG